MILNFGMATIIMVTIVARTITTATIVMKENSQPLE